MKTIPWFERKMSFGLPKEMLPFYLERLRGTAVRIEKKVEQLDCILTNQLNGKWSVKQHIGHLAEVDEIANKRIDEMLHGNAVLLPAVFEPKNYNPWPVKAVIEYFETTRSKNLQKYQTIHTDDLLKFSEHPRLKMPMTPVDLAWFDAGA